MISPYACEHIKQKKARGHLRADWATLILSNDFFFKFYDKGRGFNFVGNHKNTTKKI